MSIVLVSSDLATASRVEGAAKRAGVAFRSLGDIEAAVASGARLLLVDLAGASIDVTELIRRAKTGTAHRSRILAFGPHVHRAALDAARDAGCDEVLTRGQFFAELDAIVNRAANDQGDVGGG